MSFPSMFLRSATGVGLVALALVSVIIAFPGHQTQVDACHLAFTAILTGIGFGLGYSCWYIGREPTFTGSFLVGCLYLGVGGVSTILQSWLAGFDVFLLAVALVPVLGLLIGGGAFVAVKVGRRSGVTK